MFFIVGTGHCGTKWLSKVLNQPSQRVICYHEHRNIALKVGWQEGLEITRLKGLEGFKPYFDQMNNENNNFNFIGDSNSWTPVDLITYNFEKYTQVDKIIVLIRNGIQCINSIILNGKEEHLKFLKEHPYQLKQSLAKIKRFEESNNTKILGEQENALEIFEFGRIVDWAETYTLWLEKLIEKYGEDKVIVCRLEDLTTDFNSLYSLVKIFGLNLDEQIPKLQKDDVNRKIKGRRDANYIWDTWDPLFKEKFKRITKNTMEKYNYEI